MRYVEAAYVSEAAARRKLDTFISSSIKIRESHTRACPVIHLDPGHKLSGELTALYDALDHREAEGPDVIWSPWLWQSA
jgi:hypothetical protein